MMHGPVKVESIGNDVRRNTKKIQLFGQARRLGDILEANINRLAPTDGLGASLIVTASGATVGQGTNLITDGLNDGAGRWF